MNDSLQRVGDSSAGAPDKVGSVLVVGAGIAGMQAALDCADAGFRTYLVEQQPAIGGNMARLDKTFPTNDCAMCMISPKLVETGRHLNIEVLSYADLDRVTGEPGNFTVSVKKKARYVSEELCNGCADCERACPVEIEDDFNGMLCKQKAIYRLYPQAIPNVFTVEKNGISPCRLACPGGVNAHGYVALISQGKYKEALALNRETNPFTGSCGMVCTHPCEKDCYRGQVDEPVSICGLKRFVFENVEDEAVSPEPPSHSEKVAIIGAGPTGLSCAYQLRRMGYPVTVFESLPHAGGMLRAAIPDFRLPRDVVERDVTFIRNSGVEIRLNTAVGKDVSFEQLRQEYAAVMVASGAPKPRTLDLKGVPEEGAEGLLHGIKFLADAKMGTEVKVGPRVAVVGGGNTAMDAARAAKRLGGENVTIVYRRTEKEMPAIEEEVELATSEGIDIMHLTSPVGVEVSDGKVRGVTCMKMELGEEDESGRRRPRPVPDSEFDLVIDTVIIAIGQYSDLSFLPEEFSREKSGSLAVDDDTMSTGSPGVFAGGDVASGPDIVIQAVGAGRKAAISIDRHLRGEPLEPVHLVPQRLKAKFEEKERPRSKRRTLYHETETVDPERVEQMAREEAERCLNCSACCECFECVRVCEAKALEHDGADRTVDLNVGAIILSGGYDPFDATIKSEYSFGRAANVVTSIQFERILSASGPYEGHLQRPSDGKTPARIAWIQCVGSRDVTIGNDYCSSVCCMYAVKEALIAKEHEKDVDATIFYTDLRAFGKGFEGFYNRAKDEAGVRFVRSMISSVKENAENQNVVMRYVDEETGSITEEEFDMVVLSIGLVAHHTSSAWSDLLGIECNRFGFAEKQPFQSCLSTREGVFLSGAAGGPKDIPETVMQSSAAAALCGEFLAPYRGTQLLVQELPPEKDVWDQGPRIGVFVCHCGSNISSVIDVEAVAEYAKELGCVVHAENTLYTCSQDTQERIKDLIREKDLNRVIVASCTPRTHESLFQQTLREAGLNPYLFEMVNIREQCSWVHQGDKVAATEKAKTLLRGGVGKASLLEPLNLTKVGVTRSALVIGGGMSGMTAALSLSRQGFQVDIVEKEKALGGNMVHIKRSIEGYDWQEYLRTAISEVGSDSNIVVHLDAEVEETSGFVGNFATRLKGREGEISHGVTIVATGAEEWRPDDFLYGDDDGVVTQRELEAMLSGESVGPEGPVVMIQCVGSRNEEHEYCSRVCCSEAVKNALSIKERTPDRDVTVLYRDIRTYEFNELFYRKAREKGVKFMRFPDEEYPVVSRNGNGLIVSVQNELLGAKLELPAGLVVLSAANVAPKESNEKLASMLKVPLDKDGFFMEAHVKLRPVDFANAGSFVCGLAHSPKNTEENIAQALAAAGRAACVLSRQSLDVGGVVAKIDQDKCASCLTCIRECAYSAPFINADGKAEIEAAKCQGCGNCAAACPAKAIQLSTFTDAQESALFDSILNEDTHFCEVCNKTHSEACVEAH